MSYKPKTANPAIPEEDSKMYGTIARMKTKKGALDEIRNMETSRQPGGYMGTLVFQSDDDTSELWIVAIFRDKDAYFANADSPEQDAEFQRLRSMLEADPEWHDGEIVFSHGSIQ
jgi:quinol monooxygenase YgiN